MKSIEFSAKTPEKAIEKGLLELKKTRDEVDIKILSTGGLFSKAKVLISYDENEVYEDFVKDIFRKETKKEEKKEEIKIQEPVKEEVKLIAEENHEEIAEEENHETLETLGDSATNFLKGLFDILGQETNIIKKVSNDSVKITLSSEFAGNIIGYRGEGLNALQYLCNTVELKTNKNAKRIIIDIENYRERREESLKALAHRISKKCLRLKRPVKLEPMNAYERRILHTEIQTIDGVTTHSEGVEPHRYLVVELEGRKND